MRLAKAGLLVTVTTFACSSSPSTSLDPSAKLNTLSTAGQEALCDWTAQVQGGYGAFIPCAGGAPGLEVAMNQATCVAESVQHFDQPTCTATVGDWMTCVKWALAIHCSTNPPAPTGQCAAIDTGCYGTPSSDAAAD